MKLDMKGADSQKLTSMLLHAFRIICTLIHSF